MTDPDRYHLAASYALSHKVNRAFRKFWRSLDERDQASIARAVADHFKLANFIKGPPTPLATSDQFPRMRK
jgi:hypothetical protein